MTIALGGLQIACTKKDVDIIESAELSDNRLLTITAVMRRLLPHEDLDPAVYRDAVTAFSQTAMNNETAMAGLAKLESRSFLDLPASEQLAILAEIENTPFFNTVRAAAIRSVYGDERTWEMLGYGGDASRFGGYVDRGFNDIDWLPDVGRGTD